MRVLTLGTFDLLHIGHVNLLRRAARLGNELYVGVNTDRFVEHYKGSRPLICQQDRARIVEAIKGVTAVRMNDGPGRELIEQLAPQIIAIGSDWHTRDYLTQIDVEQGWLVEHGVTVAYLPYTPSVSTSELKLRLVA